MGEAESDKPLLPKKPVFPVSSLPSVGANDEEDRARIEELRARCTRFLNSHGNRPPSELLARIPDDTQADRYGKGGVVEELEAEVADLLGKPAAVFVPTGTMAQQIVLRIHADRRGRRSVVWHPACHLDWHEGRGYQWLHNLVGIPVGDMRAPLTLDALATVAETPAALLIELPQRDLGGVLPPWDEMVAMTAWARQRGAAVHMDGARIWEAAAGYGRSEAEVADAFDTVYASFYKGLGAISGCCVVGPADVIAAVSEWRTRHGGRAFALWPYAASALAELRSRRCRMPDYLEHARLIAAAMTGFDWVRVLPDPPQTSMMHLQLRVSKAELLDRALAIADSESIWTFPEPFALDDPTQLRIEMSVGDATLGFSPDEIFRLLRRLATGG
jgi:threonine aldolase